jgi:predicted RNA methylase
VRLRGYSALPWRCAVLAVDTAGRSGWSARYAGVQSAYGEVESLDSEALAYIVRWFVHDAQALALAPVLVLESPYGGNKSTLLALGAARERWLTAWRAVGLLEKRVVKIEPSRWRRHVLGPAYTGMRRDVIREHESTTARALVGEAVGPDEAAAILIGVWADRAPEVGAVLGRDAKAVSPATRKPVLAPDGAPSQRAELPRVVVVNQRKLTREQRERSQWYTPPKAAAALWRWALQGGEPVTVLEPAAGLGALIEPVLAAPHACTQITAIDLDAANVAILGAMRAPLGVAITAQCGDFLAGGSPDIFDLCLMNPPYESGKAEAFIVHALKYARRVCGIFKTSLLHGKERHDTLWTVARITRLAPFVLRPSFGRTDAASGGKTDYMAFEIVARAPGEVPAGREYVEIEPWRL